MNNLGLAILGVNLILGYCGVVTIVKAIREVKEDEVKRRKTN